MSQPHPVAALASEVVAERDTRKSVELLINGLAGLVRIASDPSLSPGLRAENITSLLGHIDTHRDLLADAVLNHQLKL